MTDQLIAPVIPPAADPVRGGPRRAGGGRPLPLADPLAVPLDAVYGMSRIDTSGRLTSQAISHVLNWRADDRLTLTAAVGVMVARRDRHGMVTVPARCFIAIPAALQHRCGLRPRDRVLLAASTVRSITGTPPRIPGGWGVDRRSRAVGGWLWDGRVT